MKRRALQVMAVGSAVGFVGCVALSIRIVVSVSREWGNVNSLQLSVAGIGLATTCWGVFLFGRYSFECVMRANEAAAERSPSEPS